jgi:hypothetical protein
MQTGNVLGLKSMAMAWFRLIQALLQLLYMRAISRLDQPVSWLLDVGLRLRHRINDV